jgi:hypothetical protein
MVLSINIFPDLRKDIEVSKSVPPDVRRSSRAVPP